MEKIGKKGDISKSDEEQPQSGEEGPDTPSSPEPDEANLPCKVISDEVRSAPTGQEVTELFIKKSVHGKFSLKQSFVKSISRQSQQERGPQVMIQY